MKINVLLLIVLISCSFLVVAQEEGEILDLGNLLGIGGNVTASGIDYSIEETSQRKDAVINFNEENSFLKIGNNTFENIQPSSEKQNAFVKLNEEGKIIEADFMTNENGGSYEINGVEFEAPPNSWIRYNQKRGIFMRLEENSTVSSFPKISGEEFIEIRGDDSKLPGGQTFSGNLIFDSNENPHLPSFGNARIEGILLEGDRETKTRVYFDGKEKEDKSYVSLGQNNLVAKGDVKMNFGKNNKYAKIEESDLFSIDLEKNSKVVLTSNQDRIPFVDTFGNVEITQDSKIIKNKDNQIFMDNGFTLEQTTSPIKLSFFDEKEKPIFGIEGEGFAGITGGSEHEILVDNFNRFAIIPKNSGEEFYANSEGIDTKFSSRLSYNYVTEEDLNLLTRGKINSFDFSKSYFRHYEGYENLDFDLDSIEISEGERSLMMGRIRDYWSSLTYETENSIDNIYLISSSAMAELIDYDAAGAYEKNDNAIYLIPEEIDIETFRHEMSHARYNNLVNQKKKEIINDLPELKETSYKELNKKFIDYSYQIESLKEEKRKLDYADEMMEVQHKINELEEKKKGLQEIIDQVDGQMIEESSIYKKEWEKIAEINYGYTEIPSENYPTNGLIRKYSEKFFGEDMATYLEKVNEPEFFSELINPKSEAYDPRYLQKLNYLYKYHFISDSEYDAILEAAGI